MKNKWCLIIGLIVFTFMQELSAQYTVSGKVQSEKGEPLYNVSVFFTVQDTLVAGTVSDEKGKFQIRELPENTYQIQYLLLGYKSKQQQVTITGDSRLETVQLEEDPVALGDVVVDANRSDVVKMEAGMTTFYISSEMKKKARNALEALHDVPLLTVDETTNRVELIDGSSPIILINGVKRGGDVLRLLEAKNIEAVEVIENPSARYMGEGGMVKVLNLKMKRNIELSQAMELSGHQAFSGVYGYYGGFYGFEGKKASLQVSVSDWYTHKIGKEVNGWTNTGNLERRFSNYNNTSSNCFSVYGNGDWVISDKDYLSYGFGFSTNPSSTTSSGSGEAIEAGQRYPLSTTFESEETYVSGNYYVFYRRTISSSRHLDVTGAFGHHRTGPEGWREERSDLYGYYNQINMDNSKQYARTELNYDFVAFDKLAMNIGSNTYFQNVLIQDQEGEFPYKETREYLYGDLRNKNQSKFSYMFSLGLDLMFRNSGGVKSNFVTVVPSLSLGYQLHNQGSFRLNASRNRFFPEIERMNPRVTTTDSLNVSVGNPYLKPGVSNNVNLSYSLNTKWLYLSPGVYYTYNQDNAVPVGYLDGNIYRHTFENSGHSQWVSLGVTLGIKLGKLGNLNLTPNISKTIYENMSYDGKTWGINANIFMRYKKVSFNGYMGYSRYNYSRTTRSSNTPMVEMMLNWDLPKGWKLSAKLRDNAKLSKVWQIDGDYHSFSKSYSRDWSWVPMIGFSYYFRLKPYLQRQKNYRSGYDKSGFGVTVE